MFGTSSKLYSFIGGAVKDITPLKLKGGMVDCLETESGQSVIIMSFGATTHGLMTGDEITIAHADDIGGIDPNGTHAVEVLDIYTIRFDTGTNATSTVAAGGGGVRYEVPLDVGLTDGRGRGYGFGPYGSGPYGRAIERGTALDPRLWSVAHLGNNGLASPLNGALYQFQPRAEYDPLTTATDLEQDLTGKLEGGTVYRVDLDVTVTAGSLVMEVDSEPSDTATPVEVGIPFTKSGVYQERFRSPPSPTNFRLKSDGFTGTVNSLKITVEQNAYRVMEAPPYALCMDVDSRGIVMLGGTLRVDGVYDPRIVRTSDINDIREWLPSDENSASESPQIALGSRIVAIVPTDRENILFTDQGPYSMAYTGQTADVFRYQSIGGGAGLVNRHAAREYAGQLFWYATDGNFYIYRGGVAQSINCPLRLDVADNIASGQRGKIACYMDSTFFEVKWLYPDSRDGKECNRSVVFNWVEDIWYNDVEDRTFYLDDQDAGNLVGFGSDRFLYAEEVSDSANGNPLQTRLETAWFDIGDGHNFLRVDRFLPDFHNQIGDVQVSFSFRHRANDVPVVKGPYKVRPDAEQINFRGNGRHMKMLIESNVAGTAWQLGRLRLDIKPVAARR
jgi:hypothetical protein